MMNIVYEWLHAFAGLWLSPFYYLALLLVAIYLRKQIAMERRLFSVKLHRWWNEWWRLAVWGMAVGAAVSIVFLLLGAAVTWTSLLWLWGIALLLSLIRVRYFCFAYAAGVLGLLQAAVNLLRWEELPLPDAAAALVSSVQDAHMPSIFVLVGVLHAAEAGLVRASAGRLSVPLFFEGKRGKPIGGYLLQAFWPVPALLLMPMGAQAGVPPWPTLFGDTALGGSWGVMAFPVLIGFQSLALTQLPQAKAKQSALRIGGYGLLMLALGVGLFYVPNAWLIAVAAVLCFGLHELIAKLDRRAEELQSPYFVHDRRGLKVLAVLPHSPAHEMGIEPGYVVHKVNGELVQDRAQLHAALRMNAAFAKLEVLDRNGESRFMQRAVYSTDHHQLGLVLCPDDRVLHVVEMKEVGLFGLLRSRRSADAAPQEVDDRLSLPPSASG